MKRVYYILWRDDRVVEGAALEMLFKIFLNKGSNPFLSNFSVVDNYRDL